MSKSTRDVEKLLESFQEGLVFSVKNLSECTAINSSKVELPTEELSKLCKLIRAHSTRIGLIYKQPLACNPAFDTLSELSRSCILLVSLVSQFHSQKAEFSHLFVGEIVTSVKLLLESCQELCGELAGIVEAENNAEGDMEGKLRCVGKIWEHCDGVSKLAQEGKVALLKSKIQEITSMVADAVEEFEEWCNNPVELGDDPFDFNPSDSESADESDGEVPPEVVDFGTLWVQKIKLIKVLLNSFIKSIPESAKGADIDSLENSYKKLAEIVDDLTVCVMMDGDLQGAKRFGSILNRECDGIILLVRGLNKGDTKKIRWLDAWSAKYDEIK